MREQAFKRSLWASGIGFVTTCVLGVFATNANPHADIAISVIAILFWAVLVSALAGAVTHSLQECLWECRKKDEHERQKREAWIRDEYERLSKEENGG